MFIVSSSSCSLSRVTSRLYVVWVRSGAYIADFLKYVFKYAMNYVSAPGLPWEAEGRWQWRSLRSLALPSFAVHQLLSLVPCAVTVHGTPGHNRWGVVETPLPAKSQGRNLDVFFFSCHQVVL